MPSFSLADLDTADTGNDTDDSELPGLVERIADLQARLYAEEERALLVVLQGIDAAGKDSSVAHVFRGTNPQGVRVLAFQERLEREDKHYKFSANDVRERRNWDAYQQAYEDALNATSTEWAPWHVVPSDHKWFRNLTVARLVAETLERMDPQWPEPEEDLEQFTADELDQLSRR